MTSQRFPDPIDLEEEYTIIEPIGSGASGTVYKVLRKADNVASALKILDSSQYSDEKSRQHFRSISEKMSVMRHLHIVDVRRYGVTHEGILFLEMELVNGETLRKHLKQEIRLSVKNSVYFVLQILRGLEYAHTHRIIHRDLKPENLMLCADGRNSPHIKILDFGIAKHQANTASTMTDGRGVLGTPGYFSPEEVLGHGLDWRSDLYSVGVIWYEMLVGVNPFRGKTPIESAARHVDLFPERPSDILGVKRISGAVDALVMKLLCKKREQRAENITSIIADVEAIHEHSAGTISGQEPELSVDAEMQKQTIELSFLKEVSGSFDDVTTQELSLKKSQMSEELKATKKIKFIKEKE